MTTKINTLLDAISGAAIDHDMEELEELSNNLMEHIEEHLAGNPKGYLKALEKATNELDHERVSELCNKLIKHLRSRSTAYPIKESESILSALRKKRYFDLIIKVSDILIQTGRNDAVIRRQHAQALLDKGFLSAGLEMLSKLQTECAANKDNKELAEAQGLIGRAHKQLYMDAAKNKRPGSLIRQHLNAALDAYSGIYIANPKKIWHGVNTLALLQRGKLDKIRLSTKLPASRVIGKKVVQRVSTIKDAQPWDFASAAEACLALGNYSEALKWIVKYTDPKHNADAFEYAGTLRQFEEVWGLKDTKKEHARILNLLRSALLHAEGGHIDLDNAAQSIPIAITLKEDKQYEQILGADRYQTYRWYTNGLDCAASTAQVCNRSGTGIGTGFVLAGEDVHPRWANQWVFVTNAHVISDEAIEQKGDPAALPANEALIRFEAIDLTSAIEVGDILFSSPRTDLDCTIVSLDASKLNLSKIKPYRIARRLPLANRNQRVYIIGYPRGGRLSFSINDNLLIDHEKPKVHYRAPTEDGSSGSPVFNDQWQLIALHHLGGSNMNKLNGNTGTYPANEGIAFESIKKAVAAQIS